MSKEPITLVRTVPNGTVPESRRYTVCRFLEYSVLCVRYSISVGLVHVWILTKIGGCRVVEFH